MDFPQRLYRAIESWRSWRLPLVEEPKPVCEILGGLTNQSFLVTSGSYALVVRLNSPKSLALGINRRREHKILQALEGKNIAPTWYYWDEDTNASILEYMTGNNLTSRDLLDSNTQKRIKECVATYQTVEVDIPHFNYLGYLDKYWETVNQKTPSFYEEVRERWSPYREKLTLWQEGVSGFVLTHHDFNPANIIKHNDDIRIIDWEYAGLGVNTFDLTYILHREQKKLDINFSFSDKSDPITEELMYWLDTLWEKINTVSD